MLLAASVSFGQFLGPPSNPIAVQTTVSTEKVRPGQTFELRARFTLAPGVHLYKRSMKFRWDELKHAKQVEILFPPAKKIPNALAPKGGSTVEVYEGTAEAVVRFVATGEPGESVVMKGRVGYQGCTAQVCFRPGTQLVEHSVLIAPGGGVVEKGEGPEVPSSAAAEIPKKTPPKSLGEILLRILAAFAAGIAISFTPCVYPMIPITAAIVGGGEEKSLRKALAGSLTYVLGLSITYSILGVLVARVGGQINAALRSAFLLVPIAGVFILLGLSMFDLLLIQTPARLASRLQGVAGGRSGKIGIFLMGVVSGLVASPCVAAPLAGILLYVANTGDAFIGFWMLFALAWGMGLVLIAAGTFTGLLPKAGMWMEWIKRLFGFVMFWAAVYFLRPVVGESAYYLLSGLVILAGVVFLGGLDTLTAESSSAQRMIRFVGLVAVLLGGAMAVMGGGRLLGWLGPETETGGAAVSATQANLSLFKEATVSDFEKALKSGKPMLLDFYADWCAICKELDHKTFSDPRVRKALARFAAMKVDIDASPALAQRLRVVNPPYVAFFDSDGTERKDLHFYGFKGPEELLKRIEKVR